MTRDDKHEPASPQGVEAVREDPAWRRAAFDSALADGRAVSLEDRVVLAARDGTARRILVVDDSVDSALSMATMLRLFGNSVRTAHDGAEAVAMAEQFRPDVVLMDLTMPRVDGLEAARRIRAEPWGCAMAIIALTGRGMEGDRAASQAAGCTGHLVKPVPMEDLENLLAGRQAAGDPDRVGGQVQVRDRERIGVGP